MFHNRRISNDFDQSVAKTGERTRHGQFVLTQSRVETGRLLQIQAHFRARDSETERISSVRRHFHTFFSFGLFSSFYFMYVRAFPFLLVLFWFSTPWSLILVNHGVTLMRRYGKLTATGRGMRTETPHVSLGRNDAITIPSAREISTVLQRHPHDKVQTFRHAGSHESVPELSRSFHSLAAVADMCQFLQRYNRSCENTSTFPSIRN